MPNARKLARKSVGLAMDLGLSRNDAAQLVQAICDEAAVVIRSRAPEVDLTWLANIASECYTMRQQAGLAALAVSSYSANVTRWAADFDRGHSGQRLGDQAR